MNRLTRYRGVEQLVARQAHNLEVVGSSPSSATIEKRLFYSTFCNIGVFAIHGVFLKMYPKCTPCFQNEAFLCSFTEGVK